MTVIVSCTEQLKESAVYKALVIFNGYFNRPLLCILESL